MTSFAAILTLARQHPGADLADTVHEGPLDAHGAVTGTDDQGRARIVISIDADNLPDATATARDLFATFTDAIRLEVMTADEYHHHLVTIPHLLTASEAGAVLNITRQAVLKRVDNGTLTGLRIGRQVLIPAANLV